MAERVLPGNWGITTPEQLLSNLRVAENGGDIAECADALEWMLGSRRLVDREDIDYEAAGSMLAELRRVHVVMVDADHSARRIIGAALGEDDPSTVAALREV